MDFKVILVDDEFWALKSIEKSFKWENFGFSVVESFTNSIEAFDAICKIKPDVVFTDIRMPEISGLKLVQMVREKGLETLFVLISGFADFSYAREAICCGVFEYLLKPLDLEECEIFLAKLARHLTERKKLDDLNIFREIAAGKKNEKPDEINIEIINANFKKLLVYLNENYDKELKLKELSGMFFINFTYCSELFRKATGRTFTEYLAGVRMGRACEQLRFTDFTTEEIAERVGFKDYFYFNKFFKKYYGLTPNQYRMKSR